MSTPINNNGKNINRNFLEPDINLIGSESAKRGRYSLPKKATAPNSKNGIAPPLPWDLKGKTSRSSDLQPRREALKEKKVVHYSKAQKQKNLSPLKRSDESSISSEDTGQVLKITSIRNNLKLINPHYSGRKEIGDQNCLPCVISFYNWVTSGTDKPGEVDVDAKPQKEHMYHVSDKISLLQDAHIRNLNNRKEPLKVDEDILKLIENHDETLSFKPMEFHDLEKYVNAMPWQQKDETHSYKSGIIFLNEYVENDEEMSAEVGIDAHFLNFYCYKVNDKESKIYIVDPQKCEVHDIERFKERCADKYEDEIQVWSESDSAFNSQKYESEQTYSKRKRNDDGEILSIIEVPKSPKKHKYSKPNSSESVHGQQTQSVWKPWKAQSHLYRAEELDSPEKIFSMMSKGDEFRVQSFSYRYVPALLALFQESLINEYELVWLLSVKDLEGYTVLENNVIWQKNLPGLKNLDLDILANILAIQGKDDKILFSKELIRGGVLFDFLHHKHYIDPLFKIIEYYRK